MSCQVSTKNVRETLKRLLIDGHIDGLFTDEGASSQRDGSIPEGIDLDEINEFAQAFKLQRLSLGLTQTQVGQALSVTEGPAYSQSAICR